MRIWTRLAIVIVLVLASVLGCKPKTDLPPTLVATLALPTNASATPPPTTLQVEPPLTLTAGASEDTATPTETPLPTPTPIPLAATVNGQSILLADYEREMLQAGELISPQLVLDAMIEMLLLEQAAAAADITVTDDEIDALLQADVEAVGGRETFDDRLAANQMTQEDYRAKVRANLLAQRVQMQMAEPPETVTHVHAQHILVATLQEAEDILTQLHAGADFDTLARTYSLDVSTRDFGGDLGFFPRGLLLSPELEDAAFALEPGQISDVIHSELLGYHIVQVLERQERPLDEQIAELVYANQIRAWRESLWAEATIERFVEP